MRYRLVLCLATGAGLCAACSSEQPSPAASTSGSSNTSTQTTASQSSTSAGATTTGTSSQNTGGVTTGAGTAAVTSATATTSGTNGVTSATGTQGSTTGAGGSTSTSLTTGGASTATTGPGSYALPPPSQCHNQDYVEGCIPGDSSSTCAGKCTTVNACQESTVDKPGADVTFICPRFMLFSDAMLQAAIDDGNADFNYAIVGHDVDMTGIDGAVQSTCCQCYQLVFAYPSPQNERQAQVNPDNPNPPASALAIPKPLIVQSFNTAATPYSFDIYMAAGGFGANNACAPGLLPEARSGQYLYTAYPPDGQPSQGGVKPVSLYPECKTEIQWVTNESLGSAACQSRVSSACNTLESSIAGLTEQARRSCLETNSAASPYHLNWSVYAMKVECPAHLTEVTGCKLATQGLPEVDRAALTAAQALQNPGFYSMSSNGNPYETTTMEDCCRPSCASTNWISGRGLVTDSQYSSFYACDVNGVPITE